MKKMTILAVILLVTWGMAFAEDFDIRKLKWGMSYDQIMAIEKLKNTLYKEEILLGLKVDVVFGCNNKGLYAVTYSTDSPELATKVMPVLNKKYGQPKVELDYSFLMDSQQILNRYPKAVVDILFKKDFTEFNQIQSSYNNNVDERKIIEGGLTNRKVWEGGNTVVLLMVTESTTILSYRPKPLHYENKKKFEALLETLKKKAAEIQKTTTAGDNF